MDVHLPKKSLTPQDNVKVSVRISNLSRNNIESVELKLKQVDCILLGCVFKVFALRFKPVFVNLAKSSLN